MAVSVPAMSATVRTSRMIPMISRTSVPVTPTPRSTVPASPTSRLVRPPPHGHTPTGGGPRAPRAAEAPPRGRGCSPPRGPGTPRRRPARARRRPSGSLARASGLLAEEPVGLHDVLHDLVANDVSRTKVDELDALDFAQDL